MVHLGETYDTLRELDLEEAEGPGLQEEQSAHVFLPWVRPLPTPQDAAAKQ